MSQEKKTRTQLEYYGRYGEYWLDIIKTDADGVSRGNWKYIIRAGKAHDFQPGVWIAEVNHGLPGAEDLANEIVARLNARISA